MNRKQLEAMVAALDNAVDVQAEQRQRAMLNRSHDATLTTTIVHNMTMIMRNAYQAVLDVTPEEVEPLKTEAADKRSIATYDDLKAFIETYIKSQVGDRIKVRLEHDTLLHGYLEADRIDELTWMIWRNFKLKDDPSLRSIKLDVTLDTYIQHLLLHTI